MENKRRKQIVWEEDSVRVLSLYDKSIEISYLGCGKQYDAPWDWLRVCERRKKNDLSTCLGPILEIFSNSGLPPRVPMFFVFPRLKVCLGLLLASMCIAVGKISVAGSLQMADLPAFNPAPYFERNQGQAGPDALFVTNRPEYS